MRIILAAAVLLLLLLGGRLVAGPPAGVPAEECGTGKSLYRYATVEDVWACLNSVQWRWVQEGQGRDEVTRNVVATIAALEGRDAAAEPSTPATASTEGASEPEPEADTVAPQQPAPVDEAEDEPLPDVIRIEARVPDLAAANARLDQLRESARQWAERKCATYAVRSRCPAAY